MGWLKFKIHGVGFRNILLADVLGEAPETLYGGGRYFQDLVGHTPPVNQAVVGFQKVDALTTLL